MPSSPMPSCAGVKTPPLEGLGASIDMLKRVCGGNTVALDALDRVIQGQPGNPTGRNQYREKGSIDNSNNSSGGTDGGTSTDYALRRLRKDRPDLHARVLAGELSPHRAMVEGGFRKPTITIPRDIDMLKRVCGGNTVALDALDRVTQREHGGDRRSDSFKGDIITLETASSGRSKIDNVQLAPT